MTNHPDIVPDGLPYHLPEGEHVLWQGRPDWWRLAINVYHVRKVAAYFAAFIVGQPLWRLSQGESVREAISNVPVLIACAIAACSILLAIAYASARTTRYTLTNKRALMKVGIALPAIINLPFRQIDGVSLALTGADCGNICFKTGGEVSLAYLLLWPHAKPWHVSKTQPAFRDIPDVEVVATRLAFALGGQMPVQTSVAETASHGGTMVPAE
jgi:hypothetical protein